MSIIYKKVAGKNWGVHFENVSRALRDKVVGFITANTQWLNSQFSSEGKQASPFVQSDTLSHTLADDGGYLFIEFWSEPEKHTAFMKAMAETIGFEIRNEDMTVLFGAPQEHLCGDDGFVNGSCPRCDRVRELVVDKNTIIALRKGAANIEAQRAAAANIEMSNNHLSALGFALANILTTFVCETGPEEHAFSEAKNALTAAMPEYAQFF